MPINLSSISSGQPVSVLLVDSDPLLRRGLAQLIDREPDLTVAGEAATPAEALELLVRLDPDIALIDLALKGADSLALVRELRHLRPGFPVLLLTRGDEAGLAERALRAGARGVAGLCNPGSALIAAVHEILAGGIHIPGGSGGEGLTAGPATIGPAHRPSRPPATGWRDPAEVLSQREMQVITRLGQGHDAWEIAAALGLGEKTIAAYLANIRRKLLLPNALALHVQAHVFYGRRPEPERPAPGSTEARLLHDRGE
jgi:DNA-binding NarL/FixJ family response regulator